MRILRSGSGHTVPALALRPLALVLAAVLGLSGCGDDDLSGDAAVRVLLTDAPSDYVESAEIWVSAVYLQGGDAEDDDLDDDGVDDGEDDDVTGRVYLFDDADDPHHFDLLELRDGVVEDLTGLVDVEPGQYGQLRLVVDSAFVTLIDGYEFEEGGTTSSLHVPSGQSSGIKVQLSEPVDADEGEEITLLVDFDVDENFVIQGNPESPAGIRGILFTPSLQEISREVDEDGDGAL